MSARTILYNIGTFALFREVFYTLAQMGEEPLAAPHIPTFESLRDGLKAILLQELTILEQLAKAQATVDRTDVRLDRFVQRVLNGVDEHTDGNTRKQLRKKLLKGKSSSKFRRPVLGRQLHEMADWSETLTKCGVPALAALAPEAAAHYEAGKAADTLRTTAQSENRNFRDVGARKQFIDQLNAERKSAEGALAKLPFQNPALPQDFGGGFFLSEPPRDVEETIEDVKASIAALETELAEEKARLAQMEQEKAEEDKEAQAEQERAEEAESLEAQAAELLKKAAALKGKK
jgi:hypothetical protein